jgi:small subunit ribosomal protein S4
LLKESKKSFFLVRKRGQFLYKVVSEEQEFKRKKRTLKINNYLNLLKLRRFYGNIGRKQFKRNFNNLFLTPNLATRSFAYFLESRLDVVLYRANFFSSIFSARQYINHKKVYVNGLVVNKPGYQVKIDDLISVQDVSLFYSEIKKRLLNNQILTNYPKYLYVEYNLGIIKFLRLPLNEEIPFPFFMNVKTLTHNFYK